MMNALYQWAADSQLSLRVVVNTNIEGTQVPQHLIVDGSILLSLKPSAVIDFNVDQEAMTFGASFSQQPYQIYIPITAVKAMFVKETEQGMTFDESETTPELNEITKSDKPTNKKNKLTIY